MTRIFIAIVMTSVLSFTALAQPPPAKRLPPAGVAIPEKDRTELTAGATALGAEIESLRAALKGKPELLALLPDVAGGDREVHARLLGLLLRALLHADEERVGGVLENQGYTG